MPHSHHCYSSCGNFRAKLPIDICDLSIIGSQLKAYWPFVWDPFDGFSEVANCMDVITEFFFHE